MSNATDSKSLDTAFSDIFSSLMTGVHFCLPGKIISFDRVRQTCSVVPTLKRKYKSADAAVEMPVIEDVPVVFPGSGDMWLVVDLVTDSYVLLVFSERSIANWMTVGGVVDPGNPRKFDLSDAIAVPGIFPLPDILAPVTPGAIAMRSRDGLKKIELGSTGIVTINQGTRAAAAIGDTVVADNTPVIGTDIAFFTWVATVSSALGIPTVPVTLTSKITTGSADLLVP